MWKAAWLIFKKAPTLGVGWGNYQIEVKKLIKDGVINKAIGEYYHAHNQYFSALAKGGELGGMAIIMLMLVPYLIFLSESAPENLSSVQSVALAGMLLVVCFSVFALTEAIFERARAINVYIFYITVLMVALKKNNRV